MRIVSLLVLLSFYLYAQDSPIPKITVNAETECKVPVQSVIFDIRLDIENTDETEALSDFKSNFILLFKNLSTFRIPDSLIDYTIENIHTIPGTTKNPIPKTIISQTVRIQLTDIDLYVKLRKALANDDFEIYRERFLSESANKYLDKGLGNLIDEARINAEAIAKNSGITLGKILRVHRNTRKYPYASSLFVRYSYDRKKYPTTLKVSKIGKYYIIQRFSITVDYEIIQ